MADAISNTSPLVYLHRIDAVKWLPSLFQDVWITEAVVRELQEGRRRGYDVPVSDDFEWLRLVTPRSIPSEWLALDLGAGELETMALALENPRRIALLDDALARRIAHPSVNQDRRSRAPGSQC